MNIDAATIAILLTAAGAPIASTVIWAVIDFIKTSPLASLVTGREKLAAFIGAVVIVLFAFAVGVTSVPPTQTVSLLGVLVVPLAIYNIGRLAMAVHDDVNRKPNSLTA